MLRGEADVTAIAHQHLLDSGIPHLDVLPAGPRRANPAELLASPRMSDVLAWAEGQYDQVLIDSPPILAAADAAVVARWVDGLVLVVRPEKNPRTAVLRALDACRTLGVSVLGVVVNCAAAEGVEAGYDYVGYEYEPSEPESHPGPTAPFDEPGDGAPIAPHGSGPIVPMRRAA
jgi:Mrp family chromosome partitioning ATPase